MSMVMSITATGVSITTITCMSQVRVCPVNKCASITTRGVQNLVIRKANHTNTATEHTASSSTTKMYEYIKETSNHDSNNTYSM